MAKRKKNRVFAVGFGKKPLTKIVKEVQIKLDEIDDDELDLRAIMGVGHRGVLFFTQKKVNQPEEELGEKPPANPAEFIASVIAKAGGGKVDMKVLPFPFPLPTPNEICPSEDLSKILEPVGEAMSDLISDKKLVTEKFENVTRDLPPFKMKELAAEAQNLIEEHKKHCSNPECGAHRILGETSKRLTEKAKLNTQ